MGGLESLRHAVRDVEQAEQAGGLERADDDARAGHEAEAVLMALGLVVGRHEHGEPGRAEEGDLAHVQDEQGDLGELLVEAAPQDGRGQGVDLPDDVHDARPVAVADHVEADDLADLVDGVARVPVDG